MMLDREQIMALEPSVRTVQIIAFSLIMGAIAFLIMVTVMADWAAVNTEFSLLAAVSLVFGILMALMSVIVAKVVGHSALVVALNHLKETGTSTKEILGMRTLVGVFQSKTIIKYAIIESAAFFSLVVFLFDHSVVSLVAAVALILMLIVMFPTSIRILDWVDAIITGR